MIASKPEGQCKVCDRAFLRFRTTQAVCGPSCARKSVKADKKAEAEQTRARRMALRSRRDWLEDAQKAVNAYVRLRDHGKPCISCPSQWSESFQAGHWLTRGARPELRFNLDNIHGQCCQCNLHFHGNQAMARVGIVARIGLARVEALEGPHPPAKWSADELRTIRDGYRLLAKHLKEAQAFNQSRAPSASTPEIDP